MSLNVIFLGTAEFAVPALEALADACDVKLVGTAPPAVRGRGSKLRPSPVGEAAAERGLAVCTPKTLIDAALRTTFEALAPDAVCVAAYGLLLPPWLLALPRYGCLNVHGSLLPRWRGAAPVERAILAGDEQCGVSIMKMETGLDTGPYCLQREVGIGEKGFDEISAELAALGAEALVEALEELARGSLLWTAQDEAHATYADKIARGELNLDPAVDVVTNCRRVQASSAAHPARLAFDAGAATIVKARALAPEAALLADGLEPGAVAWREKTLLLGCGDGAFEVRSLKPDGKRIMDASAYVAGQAALREGAMTWSRLA